MTCFETEGLVIQVTPYQEKSFIGQIFTPSGVFSFLTSLKKHRQGAISPLSLGFFTLEKKYSSSLYKIKEEKILNNFLDIRSSFKHLQAAGSILRKIRTSQLSEKPAPMLFELTKIYLTNLKNFKNPLALELSFFIKLLNHEGLLSKDFFCHQCQSSALSHVEEGLYYCSNCAPQTALEFSHEELYTFLTLGFSRSLKSLEDVEIPESLPDKINNLYQGLSL